NHESWASELVWRADSLGHDDLGRFGGTADRADEGLQARVGHERLELLDALPLVHDQDVAVADAEPVVQPANGLGCLGDLRELVGPVHQGLLELGRVALELTDDQHTHLKPLPGARAGGTGSPAGIRHRAGGRITRFPRRAPGGWPRTRSG